jgi:hypothetical protein
MGDQLLSPEILDKPKFYAEGPIDHRTKKNIDYKFPESPVYSFCIAGATSNIEYGYETYFCHACDLRSSDNLCLIQAPIRGHELVDILVFVLVSSDQANRSNSESTLVDQLRPGLIIHQLLTGMLCMRRTQEPEARGEVAGPVRLDT